MTGRYYQWVTGLLSFCYEEESDQDLDQRSMIDVGPILEIVWSGAGRRAVWCSDGLRRLARQYPRADQELLAFSAGGRPSTGWALMADLRDEGPRGYQKGQHTIAAVRSTNDRAVLLGIPSRGLVLLLFEHRR